MPDLARVRASRRAWYWRYREREIARRKALYNGYSDDVKAEISRRRRARYQAHRAEELAANKAYIQARGPEYSKEKRRRYRKAHADKVAEDARRRQVRKRNLPAEIIDRDQVFTRDRGLCQICLRPLPRAELTLDHIVPLAADGPHTEANLQIAHRSCNSRRKDGRIPAQTRLF